MAAVAHLRPATEQLLTKKQLAQRLDRSTRWIELRVREGMPSEPPTERYPGRRFRLSEVEDWLAHGQRKPERADRIAQLEDAVARLTAQVEDLRRRVR